MAHVGAALLVIGLLRSKKIKMRDWQLVANPVFCHFIRLDCGQNIPWVIL